jgi:hypothetical protein
MTQKALVYRLIDTLIQSNLQLQLWLCALLRAYRQIIQLGDSNQQPLVTFFTARLPDVPLLGILSGAAV